MTAHAASNGVQVIGGDTSAAEAWRGVVSVLDESRLAHSVEWATIIRQAYGHRPIYLAADDATGGAGVLPAVIVRRPLLGTVVTSMPFLDGGGPCSSSEALSDALVARLMGEAVRAGAGSVELRCARRLNLDAQPAEHKVMLTLSLPSNADDLWGRLDRSVRNQIRKAERSGLTIESGGVEHLAPFYDTFAARMRDLGSPVHAAGFLRAVMGAFGSRARVVLVRKGRTTVGGLIAIAFKDTISVPWASCLKEYFALCPNMLLYWDTIRAACADGVREFDFGRSSRGSGTYRFKRQWGSAETPLFWYTIPVNGHRPPAATGGRAAECFAEVWRRLPLSLTRRLGPGIRRYLTQ